MELIFLFVPLIGNKSQESFFNNTEFDKQKRINKMKYIIILISKINVGSCSLKKKPR